MMESIEFGARQRKSRCDSTEMVCSSPVSTSYGGSPPLLRDNVGTSSLRDRRAELEVKTTCLLSHLLFSEAYRSLLCACSGLYLFLFNSIL